MKKFYLLLSTIMVVCVLFAQKKEAASAPAKDPKPAEKTREYSKKDSIFIMGHAHMDMNYASGQFQTTCAIYG